MLAFFPSSHRLQRLCLILGLSLFSVQAVAAEVNIYSARKEHLMKPLLDAFTRQTGITVNLLTGEANQLLARLKSEGINTPADVLLTTDAGWLNRSKEAGVLQAVSSPEIESRIPARYRDPEGYWFGLSLRARVIFYSRKRVKPTELSTYEALTDPRWRDRLCVRSSGNIYNQSLLASLIAHSGAEAAQAWAAGMVANFARKPQGGDRDQLHGVAAGQCDIALANTYYYGGLATSDDPHDQATAATVGIFWPNQKDRGAHVNVSGAGVTKYARHRKEAIALITFLAGKEAQELYAQANQEYPASPDVPWPKLLETWGRFKADDLDMKSLGDNNAEAVRIFDRVGWR